MAQCPGVGRELQYLELPPRAEVTYFFHIVLLEEGMR